MPESAPRPPIAYMARTRRYYDALGYGAPYEWAVNAEVPFHPLAVPLEAARLALVTTAAPFRPEAGDQGPGAPYNAAAKFYELYSLPSAEDHDLRISHVAIDRAHTTAEDPNTWLPLPSLRDAVAEGRLGGLTPSLHGLPTNRSHRTTRETDVPELVRRCLAEEADAALLVPNCPVCHQSVSLAAVALESAGIATVVMGAALDIVEHAGVPRFLFSDVPLGNAAGRPNDPASQRETLAMALDLLATARSARETRHSPLRWAEYDAWKEDYSNPDRLAPEEIARRRAEFDRQKSIARERRA